MVCSYGSMQIAFLFHLKWTVEEQEMALGIADNRTLSFEANKAAKAPLCILYHLSYFDLHG